MNDDRAGTKRHPNSGGEVMNGGRGGSKRRPHSGGRGDMNGDSAGNKSRINPNSEALTKIRPNIGGGGPGVDMNGDRAGTKSCRNSGGGGDMDWVNINIF